MRDKVAQSTTNNLTTISISALIIPTNILQPLSSTSTSSVPLSSTMPFSFPDGLSHLTTTITIGTVDTATNAQAFTSFPLTPNVFDQNQPHQSTIDEGNDISFPSSSVLSFITLQLCPLDLSTNSRPEKRKPSTTSTRTCKLMRSVTKTGK